MALLMLQRTNDAFFFEQRSERLDVLEIHLAREAKVLTRSIGNALILLSHDLFGGSKINHLRGECLPASG